DERDSVLAAPPGQNAWRLAVDHARGFLFLLRPVHLGVGRSVDHDRGMQPVENRRERIRTGEVGLVASESDRPWAQDLYQGSSHLTVLAEDHGSVEKGGHRLGTLARDLAQVLPVAALRV